MDHWHTHHGHQTTQNQNNFNQRDYDQLASLPSANIYQLPLRQGYENIYHDTPAVGAPSAGPRSALQPGPWLRTSHLQQIPQTQLPFNLPARESSVANLKSLESFIDNDQCDMVEIESSESRYRSGWLGILEVDELSAANQGNYRPILRHEYGGVYYDSDHIMVPRTDPRALALSNPWPKVPPRVARLPQKRVVIAPRHHLLEYS